MTEELEVVFEELLGLFENRKFAGLREILTDMEPADIAGFMEENLDDKEQIVFFRILPKELASDVFVETNSDTQESLIRAFTDKELKAVVADMFLDDAVDVIEEMPANVVKRILKNTAPEDRKQINELLSYPDDTAGSIMTPEFISLSKTFTVEQALDKIRVQGINKETIYTCYVTDTKKKLIGVVTAKDILLADKNVTIEEIMETNVVAVETHDPREEVALTLSKYDFLAIPVIDKEGCVVGIVTVDDAVDVIQEEATEDIHKMAGVLPTEKPYLKQSIFSIWKSRVPWLLLLMISATFTSMILSGYEGRIMQLANGIVLYAFVPMLMGTSGNAGNQASATIIRAIALDEVDFKDTLKVIGKELLASLLLAFTVGVCCFGKLMLIDRLFNPDVTIQVALIVSTVLFACIIIAKFVGAILPLLAKKIKLDPAVMASPFITTIIDILSLVLYCVIALSILQ